MNEEALIPKMKRLDKKQRHFKIPLLNFALILFGVLLIICSTFINFQLKHYIIPSEFWVNKQLTYDNFIYGFYIIPQIPIIMFLASALGKKMSTTCVCLYIFAGMFFPIFALGGGIQYFLQYGFGYILSYIPAVLITGSFLKKKYSFLYMFLAALCGVLTIHLLGTVYMILIAILKHSGMEFIKSWILAQSGLKVIYDLIISFVCILIGKYVNHFIKFVID